MIAILSDVHSNLLALEAVLEDIRSRDIPRIVCLGDIIGYGPNPRECVDVVKEEVHLTILGNHDEAVLFRARDFNVRAEMAVDWTREQLTSTDESSPEEIQQRLDFLTNLDPIVHEEGLTFVHGSPRKPLREYLFPRDIRNRSKMMGIFSMVRKVCFVGHSHIPGVFTEDMTYTHPEELLKSIYLLDNEKVIVNVGSTGQPRDGDNRACYVTFDGDSVVFRRVEYDVEGTAKMIYETNALDHSLGDRLKDGK